MTRRRLQLVAPHSGEIAVNTARAMPAGTLLLTGGVLAGLVLIASERQPPQPRPPRAGRSPLSLRGRTSAMVGRESASRPELIGI